jgi:hypothetical protein
MSQEKSCAAYSASSATPWCQICLELSGRWATLDHSWWWRKSTCWEVVPLFPGWGTHSSPLM